MDTTAQNPTPAAEAGAKTPAPFPPAALPFIAAIAAGFANRRPSPIPSRAPEVVAVMLHGVYRIGVAGGAFALAWALSSGWLLLAALPLLWFSPKGGAK